MSVVFAQGTPLTLLPVAFRCQLMFRYAVPAHHGRMQITTMKESSLTERLDYSDLYFILITSYTHFLILF